MRHLVQIQLFVEPGEIAEAAAVEMLRTAWKALGNAANDLETGITRGRGAPGAPPHDIITARGTSKANPAPGRSSPAVLRQVSS